MTQLFRNIGRPGADDSADSDDGEGAGSEATARRPQKGIIDVLRFFGLGRHPVPRPVVGKRAYVRWWERVRAGLLLGAIVIGLGFLVAAVIGVLVLAAGFLLEQAIS